MPIYEITVAVFTVAEADNEAEARQLARQLQNVIAIDENRLNAGTVLNLEIQEPECWKSDRRQPPAYSSIPATVGSLQRAILQPAPANMRGYCSPSCMAGQRRGYPERGLGINGVGIIAAMLGRAGITVLRFR